MELVSFGGIEMDFEFGEKVLVIFIPNSFQIMSLPHQ